MTRLVFEAIRKVRPARLYVVADGARKEVESDAVNCNAARQIIDSIDWDCEINRLFRDENLGSDRGVSAAITWFFQQESEGILLEDDCLPAESFFEYCRELLERYRNDNRVMHIGGSSYLKGWHNEEYAYYFSRNGHISGWATWSRAWNHLDFNVALYKAITKRGFFNEFFVNHSERSRWLGIFDELASNESMQSRWYYRWAFSRFIQSGLAIVPRQNLIKDLSLEDRNGGSVGNSGDTQGLNIPLLHPPFVIRDIESDKRYYSTVVNGK